MLPQTLFCDATIGDVRLHAQAEPELSPGAGTLADLVRAARLALIAVGFRLAGSIHLELTAVRLLAGLALTAFAREPFAALDVLLTGVAPRLVAGRRFFLAGRASGKTGRTVGLVAALGDEAFREGAAPRPEISFLIATLLGALRDPLVNTTSPAPSVACT